MEYLSFCRAFELEINRLESSDCYFRSISVDLEKKRDYIGKVLKEAGMDPVIPEGGYFILANWSKLGIDHFVNISRIFKNLKMCQFKTGCPKKL